MNDNTNHPGGPADAVLRATPPPPTTQPIFPGSAPAATTPAAPVVAPAPAPAPASASIPPAAPAAPAIAPPVAPSPPTGTPVFAAAPVAATKPKRRALTWVVRSVVVLVMLGLIGVSAYLIVVTQKWSDRVDELTAISEDLGAEVATERAAKEGALAAADEIQSQLDTLKARVTDLANEEANVKDREDVLVELLESMSECADERGVLIDGYGSQWRSNSTGAILSTREYADQITEYCVSVQAGIDEFFAEEG